MNLSVNAIVAYRYFRFNADFFIIKLRKDGVWLMTVKTDEIHIICRLRCEEQKRERLRELLLEYVESSRQEEGCLYYNIFQEKDDLNAFFILDGWKNQAAVDAHVLHPNVLRINALLKPLLSEDLKLTFGQRLSD